MKLTETAAAVALLATEESSLPGYDQDYDSIVALATLVGLTLVV